MSVAGITLIRHVATEANTAGVYMGSLDLPAAKVDLAAVRGQDLGLPNYPNNRVYSSPLQRASATAQALYIDTPVELDDRLRERGLGRWEEVGHTDVRARWPQAFLSGALDARFTTPGGEPLIAFAERIIDFLNEMRSEAATDDIVVITHNGWIRTALWIQGLIPIEQIFSDAIEHMMPLHMDLPRQLSMSRLWD